MAPSIPSKQLSCVNIGKASKHVHRYFLNGQELEHVFKEKDLSITIDHELKFQDHIANKIKTANSIMDPTKFQ